METATIEYKVTGKKPKELYDGLFNIGYPCQYDSRGLIDGRPVITIRSVFFSKHGAFQKQAKSHRDKEDVMQKLTFPLRIGNIKFVEVIPSVDLLTILFRYDSIIANVYSSEADREEEYGDEEYEHEYYGEDYTEKMDDFYQPYFYFAITIDTVDNVKRYTVVQSPCSVNGRMFPHNSSANEHVFSTNCDGEYGDQFIEALSSDNLGVFLSVMNHYISDGTRGYDDYGRSYRYFKQDVVQGSFSMLMRNKVEAKVLGIVCTDPEGTPWNYRTDEQQRSYRFADIEVERMFFSTIAKQLTQENSND